MLDPEVEKVIVEVLCSQALADHLGDVRDAEAGLWKLLGVNPQTDDMLEYFSDSAWEVTKRRLILNSIALPEHLQDEDA